VLRSSFKTPSNDNYSGSSKIKKASIMRKLSISISFIFFVLTGIGNIYANDFQVGFSGIKWGTNVSDLSNFSKLGSEGRVSYYANPDQIYTIYEIDIPHVIYGFYDNQFFAVYIGIEKFEIYSQLKSHLISKYGNPNTTLTMRNEDTIHKWKYKKIKIKLKLRGRTDKMKLAFYYKPLSKKVNEVQLEEFEDKSFRFFPIEKDKKWERIPLFEF
jgi:hypothetical protein